MIEDGKVKEAYVEPDNAGVNGMKAAFFLSSEHSLTIAFTVSAAGNVLG